MEGTQQAPEVREIDEHLDFLVMAKDGEIAPQLRDMIRDLIGRPLDEIRDGLAGVIQEAVIDPGLMSDFALIAVDLAYCRAGGRNEGPCPCELYEAERFKKREGATT